jgi:hypothetical protein
MRPRIADANRKLFFLIGAVFGELRRAHAGEQLAVAYSYALRRRCCSSSACAPSAPS